MSVTSEAKRFSGGHSRVSMQHQETLVGYVFILPASAVVAAFLLIPLVATAVLVFTDYSLLTPPVWIGLDNLRRLISDGRMWTCLRNSFIITLGAVAGNNLLGLALAIAVNRKMLQLLKYLYRTALFFPVLTTTSTLAMVWRFFLTRDRGAMNWLLGQIGLGPVCFLCDSHWAIISVIIFDVWKSVGRLMILYLAGLQGIPEVYYEAARIDGASGWQLTRHVTLPLITATAFFCVTMSSIGAFQIFDNAYILTAGGPGDASRTIAMYIYEVAFQRYEMGYAATVSFLLLIILVTLSLVQLRASRRWVHYE